MKRGTSGTKAEARAVRTAQRREVEARRRLERGDEPGSRAAWRAAAESWRGCDRPVRAARALAAAMDGAAPEPAGSSLLAGVLQDCGQLMAARQAAQSAVNAASSGPLRVLALDVLAGVLLSMGEVEAARTCVAQLEDSALPAAKVASAFRRARLFRLDGLLSDAVAQLESVIAGLPSADRRFAAPRAAAWQEIAEYSLLNGALEMAARALQSAQQTWSRSGRRPGAFAAEGLALRLALVGDVAVLPSRVDNGIAFAEERGLVLLEAELRVARGRARAHAELAGASDDFERAIAHGQRAGARMLEGRARLWRMVAKGSADSGEQESVRRLLSGDRVLCRHPLLGTDPNGD